MTEPEEETLPPEPSGESPLYFSPTLAKLEPEDRPKGSPACESCPASLWYITAKGALTCYCTRMHSMTYGAREPIVTHCDGRELALMELAAKMEKAAEAM